MARKRRAYVLSPLAEADLEGIWLHTFKQWSHEQVDSYYARIVDAFEAGGRNEERPPETAISNTPSDHISSFTVSRKQPSM